jgi:hypothetical protein
MLFPPRRNSGSDFGLSAGKSEWFAFALFFVVDAGLERDTKGHFRAFCG